MGAALPKGLEVDHQSGNALDATRGNLRLVTKTGNQANRRSGNKGTRSKFRGVSYRAARDHWQATLIREKQYLYLGCYQEEVTAAAVASAFRRLMSPHSIEPGGHAAELSGLTGITPTEMFEFLKATMSPSVFNRYSWQESESLRNWESQAFQGAA